MSKHRKHKYEYDYEQEKMQSNPFPNNGYQQRNFMDMLNNIDMNQVISLISALNGNNTNSNVQNNRSNNEEVASNNISQLINSMAAAADNPESMLKILEPVLTPERAKVLSEALKMYNKRNNL